MVRIAYADVALCRECAYFMPGHENPDGTRGRCSHLRCATASEEEICGAARMYPEVFLAPLTFHPAAGLDARGSHGARWLQDN